MQTISVSQAQNSLIEAVLQVKDVSILQKVKENLLAAWQKHSAESQAKEDALIGFDAACKEMKLYKEGKIELKTLDEALEAL